MERTNYPQFGSPNPNGAETLLSGSFTIGSSGAISAQTGAVAAGFKVTQDTTSSAVGRYLVTFYKNFQALKYKGVSITGPAAGSAFPTTTGTQPYFRSYTGTAPNTQTASVQLVRTDTQADADAAFGLSVHLFFILQN